MAQSLSWPTPARQDQFLFRFDARVAECREHLRGFLVVTVVQPRPNERTDAMRYRRLGHSGLFVSELCLGTMTLGGSDDMWGKIGQLGQEEADDLVRTALDAGINFFDTANVYNGGESERIVGKALKENGRRDEIVLATKVFGKMGDRPNEQGVSRYHLIKACEDSLRRLQVDHIDLYQLHRPPMDVPQDETLFQV